MIFWKPLVLIHTNVCRVNAHVFEQPHGMQLYGQACLKSPEITVSFIEMLLGRIGCLARHAFVAYSSESEMRGGNPVGDTTPSKRTSVARRVLSALS